MAVCSHNTVAKAAAIAAAFAISVAGYMQPPQVTPLPKLPEAALANLARPVRAQIERAHKIALAHPQSAGHTGALGLALHAYEEFSAAGECYARAGSLDPKSPQWPYLLALTEFARGQADTALQHLRGALSRAPRDTTILLRLAEYYQAQGQYEPAQVSAARALELKPDSAAALFRLGRLALDEGDNKEASALLSRADLQAPDHREILYALSLAHRRLGRIEEADRFQQAYRSLPSTSSSWPDPYLDSVARLRTASSQVLVETGLEHERKGDLSAAVKAYQDALAADPQFLQAHVNLISAYGKQNDSALVAKHYNAALKLNPRSYELHYNYGVHLISAGRHAEAEQSFREACDLNPHSAAAYQNLGHVLDLLHRPIEAIAAYQHALKLEPGYRMSHFHLGRSYLRSGDTRLAHFHLEKALEIKDAEEARFTYLVANAHFQAGDRRKARDYAGRAYALAQKWRQAKLAAQIQQGLALLGE